MQLRNKVIGINERSIEIFENLDNLHINSFDDLIINAELNLHEVSGIVQIQGDKLKSGFAWQYRFIEDLKNEPSIEHVEIRQGYRTLLDFFRRIKKPYIDRGYYRCKETKKYNCFLSKWKININ